MSHLAIVDELLGSLVCISGIPGSVKGMHAGSGTVCPMVLDTVFQIAFQKFTIFIPLKVSGTDVLVPVLPKAPWSVFFSVN